MISLGKIQMNIQIEVSNNICLKIIEGSEVSNNFTYTPNDSPITIGRSEKCTLPYKSNSISREQCYLKFVENKWIINDGSIHKKPSTNGTWAYISEEMELNGNHLIKVAETLLFVKYLNE